MALNEKVSKEKTATQRRLREEEQDRERRVRLDVPNFCPGMCKFRADGVAGIAYRCACTRWDHKVDFNGRRNWVMRGLIGAWGYTW
jgi:hypothetical protein